MSDRRGVNSGKRIGARGMDDTLIGQAKDALDTPALLAELEGPKRNAAHRRPSRPHRRDLAGRRARQDQIGGAAAFSQNCSR
jgi:hypothetical protein